MIDEQHLLDDVPGLAIITCNSQKLVINSHVVCRGKYTVAKRRVWHPDVVPQIRRNVVQGSDARKRKPRIMPGLSQVHGHRGRLYDKQDQLPTSADNVTLLAFAAERRAAVRRAAAAPGCRYDRSISPPIWPTAANPPQMGQTDGRTPYRYIDPSAYCATSINNTMPKTELESTLRMHTFSEAAGSPRIESSSSRPTEP